MNYDKLSVPTFSYLLHISTDTIHLLYNCYHRRGRGGTMGSNKGWGGGDRNILKIIQCIDLKNCFIAFVPQSSPPKLPPILLKYTFIPFLRNPSNPSTTPSSNPNPQPFYPSLLLPLNYKYFTCTPEMKTDMVPGH